MISGDERMAQPLSDEEAARRLARYGPNILVPERRTLGVVWLLRFFTDPMVALLIVAGGTYVALGDRFDAAVAFVALLPIFLITAVLERRSERALEALKRVALPTARVRRGLHDRIVDAREIVPGDVMLVQEGDVFVADGVLVSGDALIVDESALTGESHPVVKEPGKDDVSAGTALRSGRGEVLVSATGAATRYGRIGTLMAQMHPAPTPIERVIRRIVYQIGAGVLVLCLGVVALERSHAHAWPAALIAGVSLAMAAFPEELPTVYTLYLALGAWRLARERALVRRLASVETLGSANVICVDKTGTLTYGRLEVAEIFAMPGASEAEVLDAAVRACERDPFDPLDQAIVRYARAHGGPVEELARVRPRRSYAFDAMHRRATKVWPDGDGVRIVSKGAPEAILSLSAADDAARERFAREVARCANDGMRVIGIARAVRAEGDGTRANDEARLDLCGFIALSDPVREDVPAAIAACERARIVVIMITGDHPATAEATARALGLRSSQSITGEALDAMSDTDLARALATARIFARIAPEQKLRIVKALHVRGDVVAMTGDGTNDALALREADIGVAMGERGTEVARAAADLVLLDDDFATIVGAIAGGRRIFRNLRRAFRYLNAFHLPLIVAAVATPALGVPLFLLPVHMVCLELIVHPTSALVYENDDGGEDVMAQAPRGNAAGLLRRGDWLRPMLLGTTLALASLAIYLWALRAGDGEALARGIGLATLLVGEMAIVVAERSSSAPCWRRSLTDNPRLIPILAATLALVLAILYVPILADAFRVAPPSLAQFAAAAALGLASTLWFEPFKPIVARAGAQRNRS
ncbi:MAG: cation-transporting P-type ATPase [bacterium]|nr:cation-transporting P-type ATPase [bacterium]